MCVCVCAAPKKNAAAGCCIYIHITHNIIHINIHNNNNVCVVCVCVPGLSRHFFCRYKTSPDCHTSNLNVETLVTIPRYKQHFIQLGPAEKNKIMRKFRKANDVKSKSIPTALSAQQSVLLFLEAKTREIEKRISVERARH